MAADDFFKHVDQEISDSQRQQQAKDEQNRKHKDQVKAFIQEVVPHLNEYKDGLEQRGVRVEFTHAETTLSFLMYYRDGGHQGFRVIYDYQYDRYVVQRHATNDDGRNYTAEGASFEDGPSWSWKGFKNYAERSMKDFFFYANRHGGHQSSNP